MGAPATRSEPSESRGASNVEDLPEIELRKAGQTKKNANSGDKQDGVRPKQRVYRAGWFRLCCSPGLIPVVVRNAQDYVKSQRSR